MTGLNVLVLPTWYATPAHPLAGVFVRDQARAVAHRHRVVVLVSEGADPGVRRAFAVADGTEDGLRVLRLRHRPIGLPRGDTAMTLLGLAAVLARLRRDGFRPDVLHAHTLAAGVGAVILGRALGVPVVVSEHWSGFPLGTLSPWQRMLARWAFQAADALCPVSESLRRALEPYAPNARVRVVPNVVDTSAFAAAPAPRKRGEGPPRLLTVALLSEKKGVGVLLEALAARAAAGAEPVRLDVAGDGPGRDALDARARELGLDGQVRFLGLQSRAEVARLMAAADLFVLPSMVETFGVALVEALAAGVPVVASEVGVAPELVDERSGVLVAPGDARALAAGIDDALARLGELDPAAAAARVRELFSPEAVARSWDEVYAEVLEGRRGGRAGG